MRRVLFSVLFLVSFGLWISFQQEVFGQTTSSYPYSSFVQNGSPTSGYEYTLTSVVLACPTCIGEEYYPPIGSTICTIPESAGTTAIPGPCSSSCTSCCSQPGDYPFCSLLSPGDSQTVLFSESGAWIVLEYTLSLNGITVQGEDIQEGKEEPVLVCVTIQYGGTPQSGSVSSEEFYASYNASDWGALSDGASISLTPITGGGFSLVYNPGS